MTSDEQAACALLAAPVSASLSGVPCDLSIPNGFACAASDQCVSGNCTDGVCCETACDQPLQQCNLPGQVGTCARTAATAEAAPGMTFNGLLAATAALAGIAAFAPRRG